MPDKELIEFDCFRLDPAEHLLRRDGEPVPLEPKVFETLLALVQHAGRLVGKDELMKAVWPDSFVEESNLTRNISILRKALHRDDGGPQYIETVPKRGYRFVGAVRALSGEQPELILQTAKVSVVVEEEESDGGTKGQDERAMRPEGEITTAPEQGVAIEWKRQAFGEIKRHRLAVVLALALLLAGVAAVAYNYFGASGQAIDSIAVLPFVNVGADPDTEYLSDGITDSLTNGLAQLPGLKVMSRNSVLRYKGRETDAQEAGRQLGVRAVLTGRVVPQGDSLSISLALVDAHDNSHLWGEQYSRKLSDLPAVQAEVARDVSEKLRLRLSGEDKRRLTKRYTENAEAYELYLKGRYYLNAITNLGPKQSLKRVCKLGLGLLPQRHQDTKPHKEKPWSTW